MDILYSTHKLLKLYNIHKYFLVLCIFRNIIVTSGTVIFSLVGNTYRTSGSGLDLVCPQFRTNLYKNSIMYSGPQLWNSLPVNLNSLANNSTYSIFKKNTKNYLHRLQSLHRIRL